MTLSHCEITTVSPTDVGINSGVKYYSLARIYYNVKFCSHVHTHPRNETYSNVKAFSSVKNCLILGITPNVFVLKRALVLKHILVFKFILMLNFFPDIKTCSHVKTHLQAYQKEQLFHCVLLKELVCLHRKLYILKKIQIT